jgi:hypothetical protein
MRWYHIDHATFLARSYHKLASWRRYALLIVRMDPPNVDQSRKAGE